MASAAAILAGNSAAVFGSSQVLSSSDDCCSTSVACWRTTQNGRLEARSSDPRKVVTTRATRNCYGDLVFDSACSAPVENESFCLQPFFLSEPSADRKTLDRWVQDYVVEIVRNIREAPFLQYIFDCKDASRRRTQRRRVSSNALDQAPSECWNYVRDSVLDASPDGLIFVRKLDKQTSKIVRDARSLSTATGQCPMQDALCLRSRSTSQKVTDCLGDGDDGDGSSSSSVDVWGLLVQGQGDVGSSCYILETTRAAIPGGTSCTRFCLTRAQCFGPSLQAQIALMWLQL